MVQARIYFYYNIIILRSLKHTQTHSGSNYYHHHHYFNLIGSKCTNSLIASENSYTHSCPGRDNLRRFIHLVKLPTKKKTLNSKKNSPRMITKHPNKRRFRLKTWLVCANNIMIMVNTKKKQTKRTQTLNLVRRPSVCVCRARSLARFYLFPAACSFREFFFRRRHALFSSLLLLHHHHILY